MQDPETGYCDAVLLSPLSEDTFLHNLQVRFKKDIIYTYVGNMLISVNPWRQLPIYSTDLIHSYVSKAPYQMPPHVYAIAAAAFRWLKDRNESQCIVITGESGSGKTEAARVCLQCVAVAGGGLSNVGTLLASAGTLLEAFGNAATQRNHNASRFGKHLDIEFDFKGDPLGGHVTHYLLEKTRVTRLQDCDRNFHVFYQLLAGADGHLLKQLKLQRSLSCYRILGCHGDSPPSSSACSWGTSDGTSPHRRTQTNPHTDDKDYFLFTKNAMESLALEDDEILNVFKLLAFILKMGNVEFVPATNIDGTIGCTVENEYELYEACELVGVDAEELISALCLGAESLECSEAVYASNMRDRFLPSIYGRLFTWLINRVNCAIKPKTYGKRCTLGVLDLYGFECLPVNSLDQLLINYTNERVQATLIAVTLKKEQEDYIREGLEWQRIQYYDNEPICDLIESPSVGVLSILSECSSRQSSDTIFLQRLQQCRAGHQNLLPIPPRHFTLHHFAGAVTYDIADFVERNSDTLPLMLTSCMHSATNHLLKDLFPEGKLGSPRRPAPLSCRSRVCVAALVRRLSGLKPRLVRCLRADDAKRPRHFKPPLVRHQLRTQGIMEMLALRRAGFCETMCASSILDRYKLLKPDVEMCSGVPQGSAMGPSTSSDDPVRLARALLRSLPIPGAEFAYGRTKVFIRSPRTVFELEQLRLSKVSELVCRIQRAWRGYKQRRVSRDKQRAAQLIARAWTHYKVRRKLMSMQYDKRVIWAVTTIQQHYVQWMRRRYLETLWSRLPVSHMSPLCAAWPPCTVRLQPLSQLLRQIHHRWRCYKYRLSFDQTARNRMREKVTASILFKDRKQSYYRSVCHPFVGDYVRLRSSAAWRRHTAAPTDRYIVFADVVHKVARSTGKTVPVLAVVSTGALLVLDARSLRLKRRVPAPALYRLSLSPYNDDLLVLHIRACPFLENEDTDINSQCSSREGGDPSGCLFGSESSKRKGDLVLQTCHVLEMATKLFLVVQNAVGKPPHVNIATEFEANFGQQIVTISFKLCGGMEPVKIVRRGSRMDVLI